MVKRTTFAPMPRAMTRIAITAKPGVRRSVRAAMRMSRINDSSQFQLQDSRVRSRIAAGLPKLRSAACFFMTHPRGDVLCDLLVEMELKLVIEMRALFTAIEKHS